MTALLLLLLAMVSCSEANQQEPAVGGGLVKLFDGRPHINTTQGCIQLNIYQGSWTLNECAAKCRSTQHCAQILMKRTERSSICGLYTKHCTRASKLVISLSSNEVKYTIYIANKCWE